MRLSWLVHPRNLIAYGAVITGALLTLWLDLSPWIVGPPLVAALVVYYFVLPILAMQRLARFDEALGKLLLAGRHEGTMELWRGNLMLRAFAPPGIMKHRLGKIHVAHRSWRAAFQAYHEALAHARPQDRFSVMLGYCEAGFHAGEDEAIRPVLARLAADPRAVGTVPFMLVHVAVAAGKKGDGEPRRILNAWKDRAVSGGDRSLWDLAEAEVLASEGKRARALEALRRLDVAELPQTIRPLAALLEAKLLWVMSRRKEAGDIFDRVKQEPVGGRGLLELDEFLE